MKKNYKLDVDAWARIDARIKSVLDRAVEDYRRDLTESSPHYDCIEAVRRGLRQSADPSWDVKRLLVECQKAGHTELKFRSESPTAQTVAKALRELPLCVEHVYDPAKLHAIIGLALVASSNMPKFLSEVVRVHGPNQKVGVIIRTT
jgi:hypothetical protein